MFTVSAASLKLLDHPSDHRSYHLRKSCAVVTAEKLALLLEKNDRLLAEMKKMVDVSSSRL